MALVSPPSWLQAGTYTAQSDRQNQAAFLGAGVMGANSMTVTAGSGMNVNISSGYASIAHSTAGLGVYGAYNNATVTLPISAANTLARIDLIVAQVQDAQYSGSLNSVTFVDVLGTPSASPVAPTKPNNSIILATVLIPANAVNVGTITDARTFVQTPLLTSSYFVSGASYTIPAPGSPQNIYAASGSSVALLANTCYEIEGVLRFQYTLGATGAIPSLQLTSTAATISTAVSVDAYLNVTGFTSDFTTNKRTTLTAVGTGAALANNATSVTVYLTAMFKGIIRTDTTANGGAGNLTPQISFNNNTTLSNVTSQSGSIFKVTPVLTGLGSSVGSWS